MDRRSHHEEPALRQVDRSQRFSDSFRKGILPENKKRHVSAQLQGEILQCRARKVNAPKTIQRQKCRGGIGTSPAEACAHRKSLVDFDFDTVFASRVIAQQTRRVHDEVVRFPDARHVGLARDRAVVASLEMQVVVLVE